MKKYFVVAFVAVIAICITAFSLFNPAATEARKTLPGLNETSVAADDSISPLAGILDSEPVSPATVINSGELSRQWGLGYLSVETMWTLTLGSPEVVVAVLDTGMDPSHPEFAGRIKGTANFSGSETSGDLYGHGTHIAGIIGAALNDSGMAGVAPGVSFLNVKVAEDNGTCSVDSVARGIKWAVDNGASVINISIQLAETSQALQEAVEYAQNKGVVIVAAAGNNSPGKTIYPASYSSTVTVTALTPEGNLAPLANAGEWVDFALPGYKIYSTLPGGNYGYETGTSFATAHMSGFIALLYSLVQDEDGSGNIYEEVLALLDDFSLTSEISGYQLKTLDPGIIAR